MKFQQVVAILLSVEPVTAQKLRSLQDCFKPDTWYYGYDLQNPIGKGVDDQGHKTVSAEECQEKCQSEEKCFFWTWREDGMEDGRCFLKDEEAREGEAKKVNRTSGPKQCDATTVAAIPAVTEASDRSMCKSLEIEEDAFLHRAVRKKCSEWWTPEENEIRTKCAEECKALTQGDNCLADEDCKMEKQICKHHTGKCYTPDAEFDTDFNKQCKHKTDKCEITSSNHDYCCSEGGWCGNSDGHCTGENYRERTFGEEKEKENGKVHLAEARARHIARARQIAVQEAEENNTRWNITDFGKCGILIPEIGDGDQFETCDPAGEAPCCSPYGWCQTKSADGGYWCDGDTPVSVKSVKGSISETNILYSRTEKFGCHLPKFNDKEECNKESGCTWKSGKCTTSQICAHNTDEEKCLNAANKLEICSWKKDDGKKEGYCHPNGFVNEDQAGRDCKDKWSGSQADCNDKWRCQWTEDKKCGVAPKPMCKDIKNHEDAERICKDASDTEKCVITLSICKHASNTENCVNILKGKDLCEGN